MQGVLSERVQAQYQAFPYPNFNLWLRLRTQEAYASHSLFAARLAEAHGFMPALNNSEPARVLMAGCGDVFPYLMTRWEPASHSLFAIDLSDRNLKRAQRRCWPRSKQVVWQQGNLEDDTFPLPKNLSHIDCYGVLHHLAHPEKVLSRLSDHLKPGGTIRLMVYNSPARNWIWHLQKALQLLGLSPFRRQDVKESQNLFQKLSAISPALNQRLGRMRPTLTNSARFVDTFMHQREARLDLGFWLRTIEKAQLQLLGLYDRYGELDDLPNPLLRMPSAEELQIRMDDRRFENNLEMFAIKTSNAKLSTSNHCQNPSTVSISHWTHSPPRTWFDFDETHRISKWTQFRIWWHFLNSLTGKKHPGAEQKFDLDISLKAQQRLSRLGVLLPRHSQEILGDHPWKLPMVDVMEAPEFEPGASLEKMNSLRPELERIAAENGKVERVDWVLRRLMKAQEP